MKMPLAVIDVGTNSVLVLAINETNQTIYNDYAITELGKGLVKNEGFLFAEQIDQTYLVIANFVENVRKLGIKNIHIIGTSASRDAKNISLLTYKIKKQLNLDYRILNGDEEAFYTYQGGLFLFNRTENNSYCMIDIGGGSTEIILGSFSDIKFKQSFNLGTVRLRDTYSFPYQLNKAQFDKIESDIQNVFINLEIPNTPSHFVGIGGTFTTLAAIDQELSSYEPDKLNGYQIKLDRLIDMLDLINIKDKKNRELIIGLEEKRAELIVYGLIILINFMKRFNLKNLIVSDFGLRFGYAKFIN
jgi:exopolyphosphatase/guanosine-5'-triphosphate,3'-diphosphate pyrophosphatase